jgi:hypothetical protein
MHLNEENFNNDEETSKIINRLRISMYLLFLIAFLRLFCSQYWASISDLCTALIVYCTYKGKGQIMSIFCLINAILGIIYSISIGSMDIIKLNQKPNQQKPTDPNNNKSPNTNNISDNNNINNFNSMYNSGFVNNNNNSFNTDNFNRQDSLNLAVTYITIIMIFAVLLYISISFFSYQAYKIFKNPIGDVFDQEENGYSNNNRGGSNYNNYNYGGIENSNTNTRSNQERRQTNSNFVPFNGGGQRLGD